MGLAMGTTAIGIFLSPWGKRSGAHINPPVTLTFFRLGKLNGLDALFYVLAQFAGGILGVFSAWFVLGILLEDSAVKFVVTIPGSDGVGVAFLAEIAISFFMLTMVLVTSNSLKLSRFTPIFAGLLVAIYIIFENPLSGEYESGAFVWVGGNGEYFDGLVDIFYRASGRDGLQAVPRSLGRNA